jgi:hypothetical protein
MPRDKVFEAEIFQLEEFFDVFFYIFLFEKKMFIFLSNSDGNVFAISQGRKNHLMEWAYFLV